MHNILASPPLKLISFKGTLLGTITIPEDKYLFILSNNTWHTWSFHFQQGTIWGFCPQNSNGQEISVSAWTLIESYFPEHRDAFMLHGVSVEEFEQQPGCSFAPSAAYLRSLIEGQ